MAFNLGDLFQGAGGGAAAGFSMGGPLGALIGGGLGLAAGGFSNRGASVDSVLPLLSPDMFPIDGELGKVATMSQQGATDAQERLTAAGLDPTSAARIATSRALDERKSGTESVLEQRRRMLLPLQAERMAERQSYMNLQRDQPGVFESFLPLIASGFAAPGSPGASFLSSLFGGGGPNTASGNEMSAEEIQQWLATA